ncbi:MAG: hypothetical protein K1000chlam3_00460 [Chlamydiae bacterium]|nr:hypothetical protein [Chlamydiota bacterium]
MNKEYDQHIIIKTLDNPTRILFWDLPDFAMLVLPFFLGMLLENSLIFIGGLVARWFLKRLLKHLPKGYLKRVAYWYLPTRTMNRLLKTNLPPSHIRRFMH